MTLGENNLGCENMGKVVANFNVCEVNDEINMDNMKQSEFTFTDGFDENIEGNDIEVIELLKDVEVSEDTLLNSKENKESMTSKKFKEYIELCNSMGLIASWMDFERYSKL